MQTTITPNLIDHWVKIYMVEREHNRYNEDEVTEASYYSGFFLGYDNVFLYYRWKKDGQPIGVPLMNVDRVVQEDRK